MLILDLKPKLQKIIIISNFLDDIMYQQFMNILWNKYEFVFIKGNRFNNRFNRIKI
jgi:hypothetical protein